MREEEGEHTLYLGSKAEGEQGVVLGYFKAKSAYIQWNDECGLARLHVHWSSRRTWVRANCTCAL